MAIAAADVCVALKRTANAEKFAEGLAVGIGPFGGWGKEAFKSAAKCMEVRGGVRSGGLVRPCPAGKDGLDSREPSAVTAAEVNPVPSGESEPAVRLTRGGRAVVPDDPVRVEMYAEALVEEFQGEIGIVSVEEEAVLVAADSKPGASADKVAAAHKGPAVGGRA